MDTELQRGFQGRSLRNEILTDKNASSRNSRRLKRY
jgi:hypothetical protein